MTDATDWNDPCARAAALRDAYFAALTGGQLQKVRFKHGDNEQEVAYGTSVGSIAALKKEMQTAEDECRASQGLPPISRRFAIRGGARLQRGCF